MGDGDGCGERLELVIEKVERRAYQEAERVWTQGDFGPAVGDPGRAPRART